MNKEKQIEEMAEVIGYTFTVAKGVGAVRPSPRMIAMDLHDAGYRKQTEGVWKGNGNLQHCSECGNVVNFNNVSEWLYNFCPNCGAKMKGGE